MKKIFFFIAAVALMAMTSCNEKPAKETQIHPTTTTK